MFSRAWWASIWRDLCESVVAVWAEGWAWVNSLEASPAGTLEDAFSPTELAQLRALRDQHAATRTCIQMGLDEQRLSFVRWLVEHGRIGEDIGEGVAVTFARVPDMAPDSGACILRSQKCGRTTPRNDVCVGCPSQIASDPHVATPS